MLNLYRAKIHVSGYFTAEDPKCPLSWRGSGCYDIEVPGWLDAEVEVVAECEEDARIYLEEYDYANYEFVAWEIRDVAIEEIECVGEGKDDEGYVNFIDGGRWREAEYEPDPDAAYEERRLRHEDLR